jgi:hypothetical protein
MMKAVALSLLIFGAGISGASASPTILGDSHLDAISAGAAQIDMKPTAESSKGISPTAITNSGAYVWEFGDIAGGVGVGVAIGAGGKENKADVLASGSGDGLKPVIKERRIEKRFVKVVIKTLRLVPANRP